MHLMEKLLLIDYSQFYRSSTKSHQTFAWKWYWTSKINLKIAITRTEERKKNCLNINPLENRCFHLESHSFFVWLGQKFASICVFLMEENIQRKLSISSGCNEIPEMVFGMCSNTLRLNGAYKNAVTRWRLLENIKDWPIYWQQ